MTLLVSPTLYRLNMAATASANRPPPAHPGPNVGNLPSYSGLPNAGQQHPGLNGTSQDPGPPFHPQHHVSTQPVFYVPAPPPAPFLQYQWPVPFPYNPFAGFPGMGECCGIYFIIIIWGNVIGYSKLKVVLLIIGWRV